MQDIPLKAIRETTTTNENENRRQRRCSILANNHRHHRHHQACPFILAWGDFDLARRSTARALRGEKGKRFNSREYK